MNVSILNVKTTIQVLSNSKLMTDFHPPVAFFLPRAACCSKHASGHEQFPLCLSPISCTLLPEVAEPMQTPTHRRDASSVVESE